MIASWQRLAQALGLRGRAGDADAVRRELDTATSEAATLGLPVPGSADQGQPAPGQPAPVICSRPA